jgi:alpha-D-glucose phosphate-specific phosphoglucomutase
MAIHFGTSGWRGIISDDFTFANVRLVSQAIADYLRSNPSALERSQEMIVGYDTRFLSRQFATAAAEVLAANALKPILTDRDCPTPVISHTVRQRKAAGAINITASHNPPEYNGIKFSTPDGAPAPPEVTQQIEQRIGAPRSTLDAPRSTLPTLPTLDPRPAYFDQVRKLVDFSLLRKGARPVLIDLLYGTGRGYLDALLAEAGWQCTLLHADLNPLFGGHNPEPNAENLKPISERLRRGEAQLGLGVDGDADRFGIIDADGTWLTPNQVVALTLYHLVKNRKWTGSVVRTVPSSHLIDAVAKWLGIKVHETPVGFKYIGAIMEREPVIVGGEESGGLSVKGHVPEKDGILACLLIAELVAAEGKTLGAVLKDIEAKVGTFFTERINVEIEPSRKEALLATLDKGLDTFAGQKVVEHIQLDGNKFILADGSWLALRASGTEPVIRCYLETRSASKMPKMKEAANELLKT